MSGIALGRKNWLHVGSVKSGPKVAAILSIIESCRRLGVPAKEYSMAVLPGLDRRLMSDVDQITPERATFSCSRSRRLGSSDRGVERVVTSALATTEVLQLCRINILTMRGRTGHKSDLAQLGARLLDTLHVLYIIQYILRQTESEVSS